MTDTCTATRHGTLRAYNTNRCRCDTARAAHARDEKHRRLDALRGHTRQIDATGSQRRIRALMALGWRARDIAPRIGWNSGELDTIFRRRLVHRDTAARISAVYDNLANQRGPSEQTARRAARAGYLPPLWWDDDTIDDPNYQPALPNPSETRRPKFDIDPVAVDRAVHGNPSDLMRRGERLEAVRILRGQGWTQDEIARRLRVDQRQITRDLADLRAQVAS